ncbi:MAG: group III truncated hemoglobin [Bacteroidia bacterium]
MDEIINDIESNVDIEILVNSFYEKVKKDEQISHFFKHINWKTHMPTMYVFWENVLFYTGSYVGNPMLLHQSIHEHMPLSKIDFDQWIHLFNETIDENYEGKMAEAMKERANNISIIMQTKILV